jgi:5-oxopent-3-ene-1,2,5-tricarboxylate decarboxylase / 2-hydroxyhepta-2,4-diene-1,7-dioate isomerase
MPRTLTRRTDFIAMGEQPMSSALDKAAAGTLFGIALNYQGLLRSRLEEFQQPPYQKPPVKPVLFIKTSNTRNGHDQPVVFPAGVERLQPGPALGVVISKDASRVSEAEAMNHVAGYLIVNEFSLPEDSYYRPAVKAKCRDGFCPIGPELVPASQITNPNALGIRLLVNGELRQQNSTANWVRNIPQLIAELSEFMTLHKGDVLITGTPEGRVDVQPGDIVAVEIDGLGRLVNTVVAEGAL